jgi:hypothetical protein
MNKRAQVLVGMVTTFVFVTAGVVAFNSDREWLAVVLLGLGFFRGSRVSSVIRRSREE